MRKSKILFQLSGSIACFKACAILSSLVKDGHDIEVVATASALKFVGEATLEGLTGRRVHTQAFEAGSYMQHIHLVRWADLIVLAPASANTLNKMAAGIGDDLVTTLFLAHDFKKPYLVAPAMNQTMFAHPATQAALAKIKLWGVQVLATGHGSLACGESGDGRMLEPNEILAAVKESLKTSLETKTETPLIVEARTKKILITAGGTEEPIDGVRSITNTSTGRTGAALATWFANHGTEVTLLRAVNAVAPPSSPHLTQQTFSSFESLQTRLAETLMKTKFDAVVHLAAVADYSLKEIETNGAVHAAPLTSKINSGESLTLRLKRNPKLVDSIRALSKNSAVKVIAFKLTRTHDFQERQAAIANLSKQAVPDFIVHNDLQEMSATFHPFEIYHIDQAQAADAKFQSVAKVEGAEALAKKLSELIGGPQ